MPSAARRLLAPYVFTPCRRHAMHDATMLLLMRYFRSVAADCRVESFSPPPRRATTVFSRAESAATPMPRRRCRYLRYC